MAHAPLADLADVRHRDAHLVERDRHHERVEVPVVHHRVRRSIETSGLSPRPLSSTSTAWREAAIASRNAPCTCGITRNDNGSCTDRTPRAPAGNCPRALRSPPRTSRSAPGTASRRPPPPARSKGCPLVASSESAATTSATAATRSARSTRPPLPRSTRRSTTRSSSRPSARRCSGSMPARASASAPAITLAVELRRPWPIMTWPIARHLAEVAGTDRATRRHNRMHAGVQHLHEHLGHARARARAASRDAVQPSRHRPAHPLGGSGGPVPPACVISSITWPLRSSSVGSTESFMCPTPVFSP